MINIILGVGIIVLVVVILKIKIGGPWNDRVHSAIYY